MDHRLPICGRALRLPFAAAVALGLTLTSAPNSSYAATTINVSTTKDELNSDGDCSLREAVRAANLDTAVDRCPSGSGADTIMLPAGTYPIALPGPDEDAAATDDYDLTADVTISGAGAGSTIIQGRQISGKGQDRVFDVRAGTVVIAGVTISGGGLPSREPEVLEGSGIRNTTTLTLRNVSIRDNRGEVRGGGIANNGTLTILDSSLEGNSSESPRSGSDGGGIYNHAKLTLTRTTLRGNHAGAYGRGGALFSDYEGRITITNSTIDTNTAGMGGGINNDGSLVITDSAVSGNRTLGDFFIATHGGGIYNSGTMDLLRTTVTKNESTGAVRSGDGGSGGGIFNGSLMTVTDSTISDNVTRGATNIGSGAVSGSRGAGFANQGTATLRGTTISNNTAEAGSTGATGGGIYHGGLLTLTNVTVSGNIARGATRVDGEEGSGSGGSGGGIFNPDINPLSVTLNNVTIANNTAAAGVRTPGSGGGLSTSLAVVIGNTIVARNAAGKGPDCAGPLQSQGYNLLGSSAGCTISGATTGNKLNINPQLGPLADNGGPTRTHALPASSPAVDAGSPVQPGGGATACEARDQRGILRPFDGNRNGTARCDIGAFELTAPAAFNLKGDFEADENGDGSPDAWSLTPLTGRSGDVARGGRYSLRFRASGDRDVRVYQVVAGLTAGRSYQFSGWANIPPTSDRFSFSFAVAWRDAAGKDLRVDTIKTYTGATNGWNQATAQRSAPTGADHAVVLLSATSLAATVYVDDVSFRPR